MPYASGLSGQVGTVVESTYGTPVTVTRFWEFLSETLTFDPGWLDGQGLKSGQAFKRASRTVQSRFDVTGDITMEHTDGSAASAAADSMGWWWKQALGSAITTPTVVLGTAYKQSHTPGSKAGFYSTMQVGRPQISGTTVQPHTHTGCKVTDWEFTCSDNQIAQLKCTVNAITLTGSSPMKTDRYGLGNAGLKGEPIENAIPTITGSLTAEYYSRTELYDLFKANTTTALQLDFSHMVNGLDANGVASGPNPYLLSFVMPAVKLKSAAVNVSGPDVVPQTIGAW